MFNFNINWLKIIKENLPFRLQTPIRMDFILVLFTPFIKIHQDFLLQYQVYVYKIRFNGQIQYLEKILNDKFSPTTGGIYIQDGNTNPVLYLYRQSESKPPLYLYRRWKTGVTYNTDTRVLDENKVYKALSVNTNIKPSMHPLVWQLQGDVTYMRRKSEMNMNFDFIVKVPSSLVFNIISMRAIIDFYRLAGKHYKIELY